MTVELVRTPAAVGKADSSAEIVVMSSWRALRREGLLLFVGFSALYLAVAGLMLRHNIMFADALSRVANGYYVLYSRDRHLPAVGFVWNPLPSLVLLPLLPLKGLFPVLVTRGFAGCLSSALFMGGSVSLLASCLRRLGVGRLGRRTLASLFGLYPMIVLYGGSGLTEPMLLFFLLMGTNSLISWVKEQRPGQLVVAGLGLGLAYLTRYEAVGPAIATVALIGAVSWMKSSGSRSYRARFALSDVAVGGAPFVFAFCLWAVMAKILVGSWLPTFSSQYGNSAQVTSGRHSIQSVTGSTLPETADYAARQITGLAPLVVPLAIVAIIVAIRRRQLAAIAPVAVLGGVLAFDDLVLLAGKSFGWLRFQIAVLPLSVLLAGMILAALRHPDDDIEVCSARGRWLREVGQRLRRRWASLGSSLRSCAAVSVVAMVAIALPVEFHVLTTTRGGLAREEAPMLRSTFYPKLANHEERRSLFIFQTERQIAAYIDVLRPPDGSVLADTAYAYSVVLASQNPKQFVITSDRDFQSAVADPTGHHVQYLLVPAPNLGPADALHRHWPGLYGSGSRVGILVKEWHGAYFGDWRLYRVRS